MLTADFDFDFPSRLIASHPAPRGEARLMVVSRSGPLPPDFPLSDRNAKGTYAFGKTSDIPKLLRAGDALVLNDTRVLKARLFGHDNQGRSVEALLLHSILPPHSDHPGSVIWEAMVKPGKRFKIGSEIRFTALPNGSVPPYEVPHELTSLQAQVVGVEPSGTRQLRFDCTPADFSSRLEKIGSVPLPPYIERAATSEDEARYQSVFAQNPGSVAAPTASLHFSEAMLAESVTRGIRTIPVTLHVGAGTFRPVQSESVHDHTMHSEHFELTENSARQLAEVKKAGGRLLAVGTTAARVIESRVESGGQQFQPGIGETRLFVLPGYEWKGVDMLLTNFHWPRSTLYMLVSSLLGVEGARQAYAEAFSRNFRLFSYGDAMLIV